MSEANSQRRRPRRTDSFTSFHSYDKSKRSKVILMPILLAIFLSQLMYLNIASFFPIYTQENFADFDRLKIGSVLSMFQLAQVVFSPAIAEIAGKFGRKKVLVLGQIIMVVATLAFGLMSVIKDANTFYIVALVLRFLQGIGDSMIMTVCLSLISIAYPGSCDKYIGYAEGVTGLGDMAGPIVGAISYSIVGYSSTFYFFTLILAAGTLVTMLILPEQANYPEPQAQALSDMDKITQEGGVTVKQILFCRNAFMALICLMFVEIFAFFYEPVLAIRLETGFEMSSDTIGFVFAVAGITYGIGAILVGHICNKNNRKYLVFAGFLILAVGMFLFGPSKTMGFPNDIKILVSGFALIGFSLAFVTIPVIPEVLDSVTEQYRKENFASATLNDRVAGLNASFLGIGQMIAPLLGGSLVEGMGFKAATDTIGLLSLFVAAFYFSLVIMPIHMSELKTQLNFKQMKSEEDHDQQVQRLNKEISMRKQRSENTYGEEEEEKTLLVNDDARSTTGLPRSDDFEAYGNERSTARRRSSSRGVRSIQSQNSQPQEPHDLRKKE